MIAPYHYFSSSKNASHTLFSSSSQSGFEENFFMYSSFEDLILRISSSLNLMACFI